MAVVGVPWLEGHRVYNCAAVLAGGRIAGLYRKVCLPNYAVFDEKRYFTPGSRVLLLHVDGIPVTVNICEDIWDERPQACTQPGAREPAWSSICPCRRITWAKGREREEMLSRRARQTGMHVCYVNGVGGQDELVFDGQSLVLDPEGRLVGRARQFAEELLLVDSMSKHVARPMTFVVGSAADEVMTVVPAAPPVDTVWGMEVVSVESPRVASASEMIGRRPARPMRRGVSLFRGGGVPGSVPGSARLRAQEPLHAGGAGHERRHRLGAHRLHRRGRAGQRQRHCRVHALPLLEHRHQERRPGDRRAPRRRTSARSPSRRSSPPTCAVSQPCFPSGTQDVTEQNIQARIRGNLLMALSNKFGWLVLTTGNKSEMAVGYATLYGDMAGGFAVLKDVPKTLVYRLAAYRNSLGPARGPIPESTIVRAPSAELADDQTDQDMLPPYEILDRIIEAYVERRRERGADRRAGYRQGPRWSGWWP